MTITAAHLLAPSKRWSASLTLNGDVVALTEQLPSRSLGFTQKRGICTVKTAIFPPHPSGTEAVVTITLNGASTVFFTGILDARPISDLPLSYEIGLVDRLAQLNVPLPHDIVWRNAGWGAAVNDLFMAAGLVDASWVISDHIETVFDPGEDYRIGPVTSIKVKAGTAISDTLDALMSFGGCGLFVLPNGKIRVADAPGWPTTPPTGTTTLVYAFGATANEYGFYTARRTVMGRESATAVFTAKGPVLPNKTIPDATFTIAGASGMSVVESYDYCQTEACAKAIASREIIRRNRASTEVDVTAPLNPNIRPGQTIYFRHPDLDFPENTLAIVVGTTTTDDTMTMVISVGAQPPAGAITVIPPPDPDFTMRFEQQPIKLAGVIATNTLVECIDTSSEPNGFTITSREWKAECSGSTLPEPNTISWTYDETKSEKENPIPHPVFVFPTLTGAMVTLTVGCATTGEGNAMTHDVIVPEGEVFTRTISVAAGVMGWRVLAGSAGWRGFIGTANCTAVPTINDKGPLLAGFADGGICQTQNMLATPPTLLATLSGTIHCLWVNEANPMDILAGAGTALHHSTDGGTSWTLVHTFGATVEYCENSPANPNEIRVCAGNTLQIAMDGTTFTPRVTGASGTLCRKVGSAPWGHLAVFSGASQIADAWRFEEAGIGIDWSAVPPEKMPVDLGSVTPLQYEEGYLVATSGAADMIRDGLFSQLGYLANQGLTHIYKLTRAGAGFAATYCTTADAGGPHKIVMAGGKAFPIDASDALRIGYGQATDPALPPELVVLPVSQSGAADMIRHYIPILGWQFIVPPLANGAWQGIDICPRNGSEWLIWTDRKIYWTGNAGVTWVQAFTPPEDHFSSRSHVITAACFTGKDGTWVYALKSHDGFRNDGSGLAVGEKGDLTVARIAGTCDWPYWGRTKGTDTAIVTSLTRGFDGEVWGKASDMGSASLDSTNQIWIDVATPTITYVDATAYVPQALIDPAIGRAGLSVYDQNIARTQSYTTTIPTPLIAAGSRVVVCGLGVIVGGRKGVGLISTIDTAPTLSVVAAGGTMVGKVVAGSLRRGAGVPSAEKNASGTWTIYAHNGVQWAAVETPDGAAICPTIGVIER